MGRALVGLLFLLHVQFSRGMGYDVGMDHLTAAINSPEFKQAFERNQPLHFSLNSNSGALIRPPPIGLVQASTVTTIDSALSCH